VATGSPWSDLFRDHPVRPADRQDPLATFSQSRPIENPMTTSSPRPRVGFACLWDEIPQRTWSYSAWNLRTALQAEADTTDIGVQLSHATRMALKALHVRILGGRLTSTWSDSRFTDGYIAWVLRRELARKPAARRCDSVLMMQDLAVLPVPFFTYQDISWDASIAASETIETSARRLSISTSIIARRRERELGILERAAGIITMSRWLAKALVEQSGVPQGKVHVVHPGISADLTARSDGLGGGRVNRPGERPPPRRRLLFVGRGNHESDFYRKGGDLVVAALALLRRDHDPLITLTVVGPDTWPLPGALPEGVQFLGPLPPRDVELLYESHDLFVMPSRMEPFGLVFAEALARGLPCVARDAYAMPEIITPGISGALITKDDEDELARTIAAVLADDALYKICSERAPALSAYFSWERAAREMVEVISQTNVGGTSPTTFGSGSEPLRLN
jgi:glycosyltransferase involved in cell wall biosynthesis